MKKQLAASLGIAAVSCLLMNPTCDEPQNPVDGKQEIEYSQASITATIVVQVLDAHTAAPVGTVTVQVVGGISALTDSTGIAKLADLTIGEYLVSLQATGYEPLFQELSVALDSNSNEVPMVQQTAFTYFMCRRGVSVKGKAYYDSSSVKKIAAGAVVELAMDGPQGNFKTPYRSVATDATGSYRIDSLPEHSDYSIDVKPYTAGGKLYQNPANVRISDKRAGDSVTAAAIVLTEIQENVMIVLADNIQKLSDTGAINIVFSEPVDVTLLTPDSIFVTRGASSSRILITTLWLGGNTTLSIRPYDGVWSVTEQYRLYIRALKSATGAVLTDTDYRPYTFQILVTGVLGNVANVRYQVGLLPEERADYNTSSITLLWSPLLNASYYEVYSRRTVDSVWTLAQGGVSDTATVISTVGQFANAQIVRYIVLGRNSMPMSRMDSAAIITVKDEIGPELVYLSGGALYGFNNVAGIVTDTVSQAVTSLPEPMDTTCKPTLSMVEGSYYTGFTMYGDTAYMVSALTWQWTSMTSGLLGAVIPAGENGAYDTLRIDFTNCKDFAGNPVDSAGDDGVIWFTTRN